jgi:hypothetical protein
MILCHISHMLADESEKGNGKLTCRSLLNPYRAIRQCRSQVTRIPSETLTLAPASALVARQYEDG